MSFGKVKFAEPSPMWTFIKSRKGAKIEVDGFTLWYQVEKDPDEVDLSKRVSAGVRLLRTLALSSGKAFDEDAAKLFVEGDWKRGYVWWNGVKILEKSRTNNKLMVNEVNLAKAKEHGLNLDATEIEHKTNDSD